MQCSNHSEVPAIDRCSGCAEPFCADCLVEVAGQKYCNSCKVLAIQGRQIVLEEATIPCKEAGEALTYAILSLFCCGILLGPLALTKAYKARAMIAADARLTGFGKATAAIVISIVALLIWLLGVFARTAQQTRLR